MWTSCETPTSVKVYFDDALGRSRDLLRSVLSSEERREFDRHQCIYVLAESGKLYRISRFAQTDIWHKNGGAYLGSACLQLSISTPVYDRMFAEYVLLTDDEQKYWSTANVFPVRRAAWYWPAVWLTAWLDVLLIANAVLRWMGK